MNSQTTPLATLRVEVSKLRKRQAPKGRRVDPGALEAVQRLLGDESRQRDLLIEHLHKIQDSFGYLSSAHLAALAGRQLEHRHTGSMTRRATTLDTLKPDPVALVHPFDLAAMGGRPGDTGVVRRRSVDRRSPAFQWEALRPFIRNSYTSAGAHAGASASP